jgi:hypothetical protein
METPEDILRLFNARGRLKLVVKKIVAGG